MKRVQDYEVVSQQYQTSIGNTITIKEQVESTGLSEFIEECST